MEHAQLLTLHTVLLLKSLAPKYFTIENPFSSRIWQLDCLKSLEGNIASFSGIEAKTASYCKYGFSYRKNTTFKTNITNWHPKTCAYDCASLLPGKKKHIATAQRGKSHPEDTQWKQTDLYKLPGPLVEEILAAITEAEES